MVSDYTFESWIADLRSDKYKQGTRRLRNEDGTVCCLGVLEEGLGRLVDGVDEYGHAAAVDMESGSSLNPPPSVATLIGLPINEGTCQVSLGIGNHFFEPLVMDEYGTKFRATAANDGYRWTFSMIADGLERAKAAGLYDDDTTSE
jgi:hypothetical protein